jgi:hypothetical protein
MQLELKIINYVELAPTDEPVYTFSAYAQSVLIFRLGLYSFNKAR